jgi:MFS family permease
VWALVYSVATPFRQAYLNGLIPSEQRATVLSSDNLFGSFGGVVSQPALGRVADVWGYGPSFLVSAAASLLALPFLWLARRTCAVSDDLTDPDAPGTPDARSGQGPASAVGSPASTDQT